MCALSDKVRTPQTELSIPSSIVSTWNETRILEVLHKLLDVTLLPLALTGVTTSIYSARTILSPKHTQPGKSAFQYKELQRRPPYTYESEGCMR
jgi:hypothetical protein